MRRFVEVVVVCVLAVIALPKDGFPQQVSPVVHYAFDEGKGTVLRDNSPNHLDGTIHNATWEKSGQGWALRFNEGAYVDIGTSNKLSLSGNFTIAAWVKIDTPAYPGNTNWCIIDFGVDYPNSGAILRVDGTSAKVMFRTHSQGKAPFSFTQAALNNHVFYHVVLVRSSSHEGRFYIDGMKDAEFTIADPALNEFPVTISRGQQSFEGLINDVAIYDRALSKEEVLGLYKHGAAARGKDASWVGRILVKPFVYYSTGEVVAQANFAGVMPFPQGAQASLIFRLKGAATEREFKLASVSDNGLVEVECPVKALPKGVYEVVAELRDASGGVITSATATYVLPPQSASVPSPVRLTAGKLAIPPAPLPCRIAASKAGALFLNIDGRRFRIESSFSYPDAGLNRLSAEGKAVGGPEWTVQARNSDSKTSHVIASGKHYSVDRAVRVYPTHISIRDTFTNKSDKPLGIIVENSLRPESSTIESAYLAGLACNIKGVDQILERNPTVFLKTNGLGIGMVALDDVFIVQSLGAFDLASASLSTKSFALDGLASYTLEWSIYFSRSTDYYDFINQVRRDEGRNGTVEGQLAFLHDRALGRKWIPEENYMRLRNPKYLNEGCLSWPLDDPQVSLEGIEFTQYPKEMAALKAKASEIHRRFPGVRYMVHLAHNLYATNNPDQIFQDSRIIGPDGKQSGYVADGYFSKEKIDQGWKWWGYYPTLDNSYGKALMDSVDVMVNDIGLDAVFIDGLLWGYNGTVTYDRWDKHSAEIDPKTFVIKRTYGSIYLLSGDALVAFCRKMRNKGAAVLVNCSIVTRTVGKENYIIWDWECWESTGNHLMGTPICLANPSIATTEGQLYQDALNKLNYGNLFFYYGEYPTNGKDFLTHPSLPARMFPITFEEIHQGWVKGNERIVTAMPGVYGWRGGRDLHMSYKYDSRGREVPAGFLTTVVHGKPATKVRLEERESAVVEKVPVTISSSKPVNLIFRDYGTYGLRLGLNGKCRAILTVRSGAFKVESGKVYKVQAGKELHIKASAKGSIEIPIDLNGATKVSIGR